MKILFCGSRDWRDAEPIRSEMAVLAARYGTDVDIIVGGAQGADTLAEQIARDFGFRVTVISADWEKHGKSAGPIRNRKMLDLKPHRVIAFVQGESRGTRDTIAEARRRRIDVTIWEND